MADLYPNPTKGREPLLMNCVYSLSGNYGPLPRLLYYCTLVFAIFGRQREWLVIGALVSALTYAGTAAIHAMALCSSKLAAFDLDVAGAWAILSTGAIAYIVMVHWSSTLRNSRARIVMVMWGFLIGVGLIFSRSTLIDQPLSPGEPACYSSAGRLLQYPIELLDPRFNCTYKCFSAVKPMRQRTELIAVPRHIVDNQYSRLAVVSVGPVMFAAYAAISWDSQKHSPSQFLTRWVMGDLDPKHHERITKLIFNASQEQWYGGYIVLYNYVWRMRWSRKKFVCYSLTIPWFTLALAIDLLCIPLFIMNVVLNELNLLGSGMPMNEANKAIGQWGPVVGSALVVYAACVNRGLESWEKRKQRRGEALVEDGDTVFIIEDDAAEVQLGQEDGQTIGVVKPKLAHVETLRDIDDWASRPKR